ncbi:MAG: citrate synthase/methylcitrate synthase, partial [Myxococcales bacterium]|nr:citrate synthase/methylcitrate synthase [Myxococcales bacterium]
MDERKIGLEGIVMAETRLSDVDGAAGRLVIAGREVEDLAGEEPFEAVVGRLLDRGDVAAIAAGLGRARVRASELAARELTAPVPADGMSALRASCARLSSDDSLEVAGAVAVFAAANARRAAGLAPIAPEPRLGHAADYLRMLSGATPGAAAARAIDAYFVTVVDHGMNASTFTARVIASTGSDLVSAVTGAIGALKGPLHGGANADVMRLLLEIGPEAGPEKAVEVIRGKLAKKEKVPGFGH